MIDNIQGIQFLLNLQNRLVPNQLLGDNYHFIKWMPNGGLQFRINANQQKSIPAEILILAHHIYRRNNRVTNPITINHQWLCSNGHTDWCFVEVLNFLLNNYTH
jgi:hypothetical protein